LGGLFIHTAQSFALEEKPPKGGGKVEGKEKGRSSSFPKDGAFAQEKRWGEKKRKGGSFPWTYDLTVTQVSRFLLVGAKGTIRIR